MNNDRAAWTRAVISVLCTLPCVLGQIPQFQGELVAWRDPRVAIMQSLVVMEGTGIFREPNVLADQLGTPVYGFSLSQCTVNLQDPWSVIQTIFPFASAYTTDSVIGGAIFANYYTYFTFGGMSTILPPDDATIWSRGILFPQAAGPFQQTFSDFESSSASESSLLNRCCGAGVSSPDQGLGFYFSGSISKNQGPILYPNSSQNDTGSFPTTIDNTFMQCDMPMDGSNDLNCHALDWPVNPAPRAEAGLIWLPYGMLGSLILIGGTTRPANFQLNTTSTNTPSTSSFLTTVAIYDIHTDTWHTQETQIAPGNQLLTEIASFCSVVVETADGQNHHIYVYGGYDGMAEPLQASDEVWVLVLPSFMWILAAEGNSQHRRQNHKCVLPSPTQILSVGGMIEGGKPLQDSILDVFDTNILNWTSTYDGTSNSSYLVPDSIVKVVGGTQNGEVQIPKDLDPAVSQLFSSAYQGEIRSYYPYDGCGNGTSGAPSSPSSLAARLGLPDWMGAVLAISLSILFSLWAILALVALRRRTYIRAANIDTSIIESDSVIIRWMHNAPSTREKGRESSTVIVRDSFTPLKLAYVDEEEVPESTTAGRSTGTSVGTYERSFLDENGEIELRTFMGPEHAHTS